MKSVSAPIAEPAGTQSPRVSHRACTHCINNAQSHLPAGQRHDTVAACSSAAQSEMEGSATRAAAASRDIARSMQMTSTHPVELERRTAIPRPSLACRFPALRCAAARLRPLVFPGGDWVRSVASSLGGERAERQGSARLPAPSAATRQLPGYPLDRTPLPSPPLSCSPRPATGAMCTFPPVIWKRHCGAEQKAGRAGCGFWTVSRGLCGLFISLFSCVSNSDFFKNRGNSLLRGWG